MRLLLITNRYPVNADDPASPFVPHFARALRAYGVTVDILTPDYGYPPKSNMERKETSAPSPLRGEGWGEGLTVHRFAAGSSVPIGSWNFISPVSWLRLARFLRNGRAMGDRLCEDNKYDHILALWALPSGHFAQALSEKYAVPYSIWCLGSDIYVWAKRPFVRERIAGVLRGASAVFADGQDLCNRVAGWLGISAEFLPSFRPLIGLEDGQPPEPTEAPAYLYLGRLHPAKGVFDLLTAFLEVKVVLPQARLRFVGGGPREATLRSEVERLGLRGAVEIEGAVGERTVLKRLSECDCVVIPSRSDSIPLVFTEAVQAMRPVIGTGVGDLGASIERYRVGLVTPSTQRTDLALTMIRAAREPVFDLQGRKEMLRLFDPHTAAEQFCECAFGATEHPRQNPAQQTATARRV